MFAPTDEAFAKIDSATLADLLKPENKDKLAAILTYHVVDKRRYGGANSKRQVSLDKVNERKSNDK